MSFALEEIYNINAFVSKQRFQIVKNFPIIEESDRLVFDESRTMQII